MKEKYLTQIQRRETGQYILEFVPVAPEDAEGMKSDYAGEGWDLVDEEPLTSIHLPATDQPLWIFLTFRKPLAA